jgi:adenosylcobinamide-GDP ribazoletransferase
MGSLILTIQFLTRLPININISPKEDSFSKGIIYFPVVGIIVGLISALTYMLAEYILDGFFPIVCTLFANILITGAMHLDGIADTSDGIFSARKRDRMLEIMKDSRIGTYGVVAIAFDLMFKAAILTTIPKVSILWILVMTPAASKTILPLLMKLSVYARTEKGMGALYLGKQTWRRTAVAMLIGVLMQYVVFGLRGLAAISLILFVGLIFRRYIYSKIQGMTGDTIGAASELMEIVYLLFFALLWRYLPV